MTFFITYIESGFGIISEFFKNLGWTRIYFILILKIGIVHKRKLIAFATITSAAHPEFVAPSITNWAIPGTESVTLLPVIVKARSKSVIFGAREPAINFVIGPVDWWWWKVNVDL